MLSPDLLLRHGRTEIINISGPATASRVIAAVFATEAGLVVNSTAAGIVVDTRLAPLREFPLPPSPHARDRT
jgi:hypothetical protein